MNPARPSLPVYFGTYTKRGSRGIYRCEFSAENGSLGRPRLVAETPEPSFLAMHPSGKIVYAVNELRSFEGRATGTVSAFRVGVGDELWECAGRCETGGASPCHLAVAPGGGGLLVTNYNGCNVARVGLSERGDLAGLLSTHPHPGRSVHPMRQTCSHPHTLNVDSTGKCAWVADLGLDQLVPYRLDPATGEMSADPIGRVALPPGTGPRQTAFHPAGRFFFVLGELDASLTVLQVGAGTTPPRASETVSLLREDADGKSGAEVAVHPNGRFVYASNRAENGSIAIFGFEPAAGRLARLGVVDTGGKLPRHFALSPDGAWLIAANQDNDVVTVFSVEAGTGALEPASQCEVPEPTCVLWERTSVHACHHPGAPSLHFSRPIRPTAARWTVGARR